MEQNNFEKNVRQKMDEFKVPPSESVWTNVQKRIGKKDKDRKVIFILFILVLLLLSGGYWLINSSKNNEKGNQQISKVIKNDSTSKATNNEDSFSQKAESILQNETGNQHVGRKVLSKKIKDSEALAAGAIGKLEPPKQEKAAGKFTSKPKEDFSKPTKIEDSYFELINPIKPQLLEKENENFTNNLTGNAENKTSVDSASDKRKTEKTGDNIIAEKDSVKSHSSKKQKQHWNIGFTLSGGQSSISNNPLKSSFPVADYLSNMPSSGGIPSYYYQPSPVKNSTAFVAGVFIEKNISERGKVALGISYKYYSLVNKVGNKVDSLLSPSRQYFSAANSYNSASSSHSYRNNFHFLEIPVSIKWQLNKNKKLPLSWEAGVNISQLISSNALQFKSNPGVYYNDNSVFQKTQFGLHTGFFVTLFSQQKMPVTAGPDFYYSATKLADKGLYDGKHFSFIGIKAEILLRKK